MPEAAPKTMAEFVKVARVSDLEPGEMRLVYVDEEPVALYNCEGQVFATDDTCTHDEASLSEGLLDECVVECPLHGAQFNVRTGAVVSMPAVTPVVVHEVRVEGGDVLVALRQG